MNDINDKIDGLIADNDVLLFMKGTRQQPQCGFSAQVVQVLQQYGADFQTIDVLSDWDLREGIKTYSNWPTIPQLYVRGKFIGGCDIVMQLHRRGELATTLEAWTFTNN